MINYLRRNKLFTNNFRHFPYHVLGISVLKCWIGFCFDNSGQQGHESIPTVSQQNQKEPEGWGGVVRWGGVYKVFFIQVQVLYFRKPFGLYNINPHYTFLINSVLNSEQSMSAIQRKNMMYSQAFKIIHRGESGNGSCLRMWKHVSCLFLCGYISSISHTYIYTMS